MKKSLLALIACLVMAVAPAWGAGWNIVGDFNDWKTEEGDCVAMTETSPGVWTATTDISGEFKFLYGNNWGGDQCAANGDVSITKSGGTFNLTGGNNIKIEAGKYKFTLEPGNNKKLTVEFVSEMAEIEKSYGIHGNFVPAWETRDLVRESEDSNEYALTAQVDDDFQFVIKVMNATNNNVLEWIKFSGINITGTKVENKDDNIQISSGGNYKFTYNPDTNTLNIDEIITYGYAIKVGDSYYALTDDNNSGTYNVVANGRQGESFQLGKYVTTCAEISDSFTDIDNFTLHSNILTEGATTLPKTASYTFAFNPLSETLTINEQGGYKYAYVLKNGTNYMELQEYFYGNWEAYYQEVPANYSFQIIPYYPGTDYKVEANCAPAVDATLVGDVLSKSGTNYTITSAGKYSFSYDPQKNEIDVHVAEARWWIGYDAKNEPNGNSWQFGIPMEQQEGNEHEWKAFVNFTGATVDMPYFAIWYGIQPTASTAWKDTETEGLTRYYLGDGDTEITGNDTKELKTQGGGVIKIAKGEWTVIIDSSDQLKPKISFNLGNSMGVANMWIIRDGVTSARSMTPTGEKEYSVSEPITKGDKLYFQIGDKYYYFVRESQSTNLEYTPDNSKVTYTYTLLELANEAAAKENAVEFWYAKDIDFVLNTEDMTVKATVPTEGVTFAFNDNTVIVMQAVADGKYSWTGTIPGNTSMRININGTRYTFNSDMVSVSGEPNADGKYEWTYSLIPYELGNDNLATVRASQGNCEIVVDPNNLTMTIIDEKEPTKNDLKPMIIIANTVNSESTTDKLTMESDGVYTWSGYVQSTQMVAFSYNGTNYDLVLPDNVPNAENGYISFTDLAIAPNTESASEAKQFGYTGNCDFTINFNDHKVTVMVPAPVNEAKIIVTPKHWDTTLQGMVFDAPKENVMSKNADGEFVVYSLTMEYTDHIKFILDGVHYTFNPKAAKPAAAPVKRAGTFSNTHNYDLIQIAENDHGNEIGVNTDCNFRIDPTTRDLYIENDIETMVADIATDSGEAIYFNLQGQRIERPAEGICIRVTAGKAEKMIVK